MKRKKNPLSDARGKQQRPENVWFRRSGAGFRLFVEYYASQPVGTVVGELPHCSHVEAESKNTAAEVTQGRGLSRASKRRKKKNNKPLVVFERDAGPKTRLAEQNTSPLLAAVAQQSTHLRPFLETMSKPLPLTFRIRLSASNADNFRNCLSEYQQILSPLSVDANIYQASIPKSSLASQSPLLKALLFKHSQDGTVARQELGSMLPVLALRHAGYLHRSSRVLDMCASPGSKTLQALEIIGESGRIVANDVLESRLESLQQAVERSGMPKTLTSRITYTCNDATQLSIPTKLFDVIICDVPCSGDGTCRKDKHILPIWKPNHGNQLHATQVDILVRAIQLLKIGGCVCYSTCSLNPIEDEAVVAETLRRTRAHEGEVELVDMPDLPGLIQREGIREWRVADYTGEDTSDDEGEEVRLRWHSSMQDAVDSNMEKPLKSMWPCSDADELHLERCTRLWPQDQDSGGFFLALVRKKQRRD